MNRLAIGPGVHRSEGWQMLDANPERRPDFLVTLPPVPDSLAATEWDEIEWIHGVGSLQQWEVADVLGGLHRILASGGKLILEQPDASKCFRRADFFGDPALLDPLHMNRWVWTPWELVALLKAIGFSVIEVLPAQHHCPERDFRIEAIK